MNFLVKIVSAILGICVPKKRQLVVFGGRHRGGNTGALFHYCRQRQREGTLGFDVVWIYSNHAAHTQPEQGDISARSLKGIWLAARAGAVCLTHSLGDFYPLRFPSTRTRLYNLWHGMPIKRISTADPEFMKRAHAKSNIREIKRYRAMFATSSAMAELFCKTFFLRDDQVQISGQPRTDVLFGDPKAGLAQNYSSSLPPHSKKILYCPTWREGKAVRLFPFPDFNIDSLQQKLASLDAVMYVRTHPNDFGGLKEPSARVVPMQSDVVAEVTDVLSLFDVLVTDYSSVYYDFLLLNRPTIFLPYDLSSYSKSPGFYLPFEKIAPGYCPSTQSAFCDALDACVSAPSSAFAAQKEVQQLIYAHVDANACQRVAEFLEKDLCAD